MLRPRSGLGQPSVTQCYGEGWTNIPNEPTAALCPGQTLSTQRLQNGTHCYKCSGSVPPVSSSMTCPNGFTRGNPAVGPQCGSNQMTQYSLQRSSNGESLFCYRCIDLGPAPVCPSSWSPTPVQCGPGDLPRFALLRSPGGSTACYSCLKTPLSQSPAQVAAANNAAANAAAATANAAAAEAATSSPSTGLTTGGKIALGVLAVGALALFATRKKKGGGRMPPPRAPRPRSERPAPAPEVKVETNA